MGGFLLLHGTGVVLVEPGEDFVNAGLVVLRRRGGCRGAANWTKVSRALCEDLKNLQEMEESLEALLLSHFQKQVAHLLLGLSRDLKSQAGAFEKASDRSQFRGIEEALSQKLLAKLDHDGAVQLGPRFRGAWLGSPGVGEVGAEENEISRAVVLDRITNVAASLAGLDPGQFILGMEMPAARKPRIRFHAVDKRALLRVSDLLNVGFHAGMGVRVGGRPGLF